MATDPNQTSRYPAIDAAFGTQRAMPLQSEMQRPEEVDDGLSAREYARQIAQQQRSQQTRQILETSTDAAERQRLARELGVRASDIQDVARAERAAHVQRFLQQAQRSTAIARAIQGDPAAASLLAEDQEQVGLIDGALDVLKKGLPRAATVGPNLLGEYFYDTVNAYDELSDQFPVLNPARQAARGVDAVTDAAFSFETFRPLEEGARQFSRDAAAGMRQRREAYQERYRANTQIGEEFLSGVDSTMLTLVAAATRNPNAGAAAIGGLVAGDAYQTAREQGMTSDRALNYAITQGVPEWFFERAPTATLINASGRAFAPQIMRYFKEEIPGELGTTIVQSFSDWAFLPENADKSYMEWAEGLPAEMRQTVLGTLGGGTVTLGVNKATEVAARGATNLLLRIGQAGTAQREAAFMDRIGQAVGSMKITRADPEKAAELIRDMAEERGVTTAFIPGDIAREYLQSAEADPNDPLFEYQQQIEDAAMAGNDVALPIEFIATRMAQSSSWTKLKDDVRITAGGMTPREAQSFIENVQDIESDIISNAIDAGMTEAQTLSTRQAATDRLATVIEEQGAFTPSQAQNYAALIVTRMSTRAARMGRDDLNERIDAFRVRRNLPEELARALAADERDMVFAALRGNEKGSTSRARAAAAELRDLLQRRGWEPDNLTDEQLTELVARMQPEGENDGRAYTDGQGPPEPAGDGGSGVEGGILAPLEGAPNVEGASGPDAGLVAVAEAYAQQAGIDLKRQAVYAEIVPEFSKALADAYEAMEHNPQDPDVQAAYADLIRQTRAQYDALVAAGYSFTFFDDSSDPYGGNPWDAMRDLRQNKTMAVYSTVAGFGSDATFDPADNPLLAETGLEWPDQNGNMVPVLANDLFRAVHDAFGHGLEGAGFRARGEENAWQAHARLFTGPALAALTTETRGQNSWLNFGPHGEANQIASVEDTVFADQKTGLMPEWTWSEGIVPSEGTLVLDSENRPALMFHGTPQEFERFKNNGQAVWFSEGEDLARQYSDPRRLRKLGQGRVLRVNIAASNPLVVEDYDAEGFPNWTNDSVKWAQEQFGFDLPAFGWERLGSSYTHDIVRSKAFADAARAAGFDAIKQEEGGTMTWGMLNPNSVVEESGRVLFQRREKTIREFAEELEAAHNIKHGGPLSPLESEEHFQIVKEAFISDYRAQTGEADDGSNWYSGDVAEAIEKSALIIPELAEPVKRDVMLSLAAVLSPQRKPTENWELALQAMQAYVRTGRMPTTKDNGKAFGLPSTTTALQLLDRLIQDKGEVEAMAWLAAEHDGREVAQVRMDSGLFREKEKLLDYKAREFNFNETKAGYYLFGPKVGAFAMNVLGRDADAVTIDIWASRTYNRHTGRLLVDAVESTKSGVAEQPRSKRGREVVQRAMTEAAAEVGTTPSAMQAALWYFEQRLYRENGIPAESQAFSAAADKALARRGLGGSGTARSFDQATGEQEQVGTRSYEQATIFYSALERAIENVQTARAPAQQWIATLKKTPGVKEEELEWTGVLDWLEMQKGPVEKAQLLETVQRGGIVVREVGYNMPATPEMIADYEAARAEYDAEVARIEATLEERTERLQQEFENRFFEEAYDTGYYVEEVTEDEDGEPLDEPKWRVTHENYQPDEAELHDTEDEALEDMWENYSGPAEAEMLREALREQDFEAQAEREIEREIDDLEEPEHPDDVYSGTKFGSWTTDPSNDTYRELLITLPRGEGSNPERAPPTHWGEDAVVAHARFMDKEGPNGERILFIEEVQSDWHQKGRDQGYQKPASKEERAAALQNMKDAQDRLDEAAVALSPSLWRQWNSFLDSAGEGGSDLRVQQVKDYGYLIPDEGEGVPFTSRQIELFLVRFPVLDELDKAALSEFQDASLRMNEADQAYAAAINEGGGIPDAPFKKTWPDLVMKRMIAYAAANGYDQIAWTWGKQQAKRYNLSEAVGTIWVNKARNSRTKVVLGKGVVREDGESVDGLYDVTTDSGLDIIRQQVGGEYFGHAVRMTEDQMKEVFGADITKRIIEGMEGADERYAERQSIIKRAREAIHDLQRQKAEIPDKWRARAVALQFEANVAAGMNETEANQAALAAIPQTDHGLMTPYVASISALENRPLEEVAREAMAELSAVQEEINALDRSLVSAEREFDLEVGGDDLEVGGEGMKQFYDKNLVNITNKLVKKYGAKVKMVGLRNTDGISTYEVMTWRGVTDRLEIDRQWVAMEQSERDALMEEFLKNSQKQPGLTITPELREAAAGGFPLFQPDHRNGPRGRILFPGNTNEGAIIELFQNSNLSTLLHEVSHLWLEELKADASDPNAPEQIKRDWQLVLKWFKDNGYEVKDGVIPVGAHEMWARGGEKYFREGKAPSVGLQRAFDAFKSWLTTIYQTLRDLRSPITPEIREVFDRLIATDEQIAEARDQQKLEALFDTAMEAGMTPDEFANYQEQVASARADATGRVIERTMKDIRKREDRLYRQRERDMKEAMTVEVEALPLFRALTNLRTERMDRDWLVETFGEDVLDLLPPRVPPVFKQGGVDAEIIAEKSGYRSASEMVNALLRAQAEQNAATESGDKRNLKTRIIETRVQRRMAAEYGEPMTDAQIEQEAIAAVNSDRQGEVLASEISALSRSVNKKPTPYQVARRWARTRVRQGSYVNEASPDAIARHRRAITKAGEEAARALGEGDKAGALAAKQRQMLSSALMAEAKEAHDEVEAARKRMKKIADARTMRSVDQDYLEQAHALLEEVDLKERSQRGIDRFEQWSLWVKEQEANAREVVVPDSFMGMIGNTNWSRLPVEQLLGLDEAVKQVIHFGRRKQTLLDNKDQRDFEDIRSRVKAQAEAVGKKEPQSEFHQKTMLERVKSKVASLDANLLKMETVFDWLDNGDQNGVFNTYVFKPLARAATRERDMLADYYERMKQNFEAVDGGTLRRWGEKVELPWVSRKTGLPEEPVERKVLIAMALNWGNAGNRQRLVDGYGVREPQIEQLLMDNLSEADWQFVQRTWDIIGSLWPEIAAMERRVNGVEPEKVEPISFNTPFGAMKGGYYPAIYDTSKDRKAQEHSDLADDLMGAKTVRATTRASATKERAEKVKRPLLLDLGVINRHLGEVIHDITHREAVIQANRVLSDPVILDEVDAVLGKEYSEHFRPWLKYIANQWAHERSGNESWGRFFRGMRGNATVVGMGFRFSTMMTQAAGFSNSAEYLGKDAWRVAPAFSKLSAQIAAAPVNGMPEMVEFVREKSGEMRYRQDTLDRDINQNLRALMQPKARRAVGNAVTAGKVFAFHGIGYMDMMVSIPTWMAAYEGAMSRGATEEEAIYAGDKAVRLSQGAGDAKDLAAIQRGQGPWGEALKLMTMFYSYMSAFYNRMRTLGRDLRRGDLTALPAIMARSFFLLALPPVLAEILAGRGPEDDEDWTLWAFEKMLGQMLGPIPLARDVFSPSWDRAVGKPSFGYRFTPAQGGPEAFINVVGDVSKIARGEETSRATRNALELVGYSTGLVPGQIAQAIQFAVDVGYGEQDPEGAGDWFEGLTKGKLEE